MGRPLRTTTWNEPANISDCVKMEAPGSYSRDTGTVASGSGVLEIGTVMAQLTKGAATSAAKAGGNTGGGSLTLDATTPVRPGAKVGVYTVRCTAAATNAGTFEVKDPDGYVLGDYTIGGAAFDNDIKFAMADSGTDFVVGDGFDITVAAGSQKWVPYQHGAVTGAEEAKAVLISKLDATAADVKEAVLVSRLAEVSRQGLKWHASVDSEAKKDLAIAQLAKLGIVTRLAA